jgi:hypothetical protein
MRKFYDSKLASIGHLVALGAATLLLSQCSSEGRQFDDGAAGGTVDETPGVGKGGSSAGSQSSAGVSSGGTARGGDGGRDAAAGEDGDPMSQGGASAGSAGADGNTAGSSGSSGSAGTGGETTCTSGCLENGAACTLASQCKSARCVDGVCCDGPCDEGCQACSEELTGAADGVCSSVKKGTDPDDDCETEAAASCGQTGQCGSGGVCELYDASTICKAASCSTGSAKSAQKCDGSGVCKAPTSTSCSPYVCGATACLEACAKNADCVGGQVCVTSACQPPSDLLGACDEAADCAKGDCINKACGLSIRSIRVTGTGVAGGGGQIMIDGWFKTDSTGRNKVRVSSIPQGYLYQAIDMSSQLTTALPPNNYLVLTGAEGSNALTRTFQFNLSDGSSISKSVQASSSEQILLSEGSGDAFMLFQWTGATINVLPKTY